MSLPVSTRRFSSRTLHDETNRLFVVEQGGLIRIVKEGAGPTPSSICEIHQRRSTGCAAFHPSTDNGTFFIYYTDRERLVARLSVIRGRARYRLRRARRHTACAPTFLEPQRLSARFQPTGWVPLHRTAAVDRRTIRSGQNQEHDARRHPSRCGRGAPFAVPPDNPFVGRDVRTRGLRSCAWRPT